MARLASVFTVLVGVLTLDLALVTLVHSQAPASFTGAAPEPGSVGLLVTARSATASELISDLRLVGCEPVSLGVLVAGSWGIHLNGAPASVNARFPASLPETTPFFVRCSTTAARGAVAPQPSAPVPTTAVTPPPIPTDPYTVVDAAYPAWIVNASLTGAFNASGVPIVLASSRCSPGSTLGWGFSDGGQVLVVGEGTGPCAGWYVLYLPDPEQLYWMSGAFLSLVDPAAAPAVPPVTTPPAALPSLGAFNGTAFLVAADGTYLGEVTSNRFASDSICNQFGSYGSPFASNSVRNEFGTYGSAFSPYSAYNEFTVTPPLIVIGREAVGYLTKNRFLVGAVDPDSLFAVLGCS